MAAKIKAKTKSMSRPVKKTVKKVVSARKVSVSKGKAAKPVSSKSARPPSKPANGAVRKPVSRVESRDIAKSRETLSREAALQKIRSKEYSNAIHAYESGLKLMHHE